MVIRKSGKCQSWFKITCVILTILLYKKIMGIVKYKLDYHSMVCGNFEKYGYEYECAPDPFLGS